MVAIEGANWESEVLESDVPVLVDFWAEWCGPCKAMMPVLDELSGELSSKLKIVKVDIDKNALLAANLGIQSVPTLILFSDGDIQETIVGSTTLASLKDRIFPHV